MPNVLKGLLLALACAFVGGCASSGFPELKTPSAYVIANYAELEAVAMEKIFESKRLFAEKNCQNTNAA